MIYWCCSPTGILNFTNEQLTIFPLFFFSSQESRDQGNPVSNSDIHCNTSYKLQHKYIHTQHQKINLWTRTQSMSTFVANALSLVTSEHLWLNNELAELRRI